MRKIVLTQLMLLVAAVVMAVPAKRGLWTTITLEDGTRVSAEFCGDELCSFYKTAAGDTYVQDADKRFVKADLRSLRSKVAPMRMEMEASRQERFEKNFGHSRLSQKGRKALGEFDDMYGEKKGIVILVNFADLKFKDIHTLEFYKTMLNEGGPAEMGYKGSVKQYFSDQSCGQFTVDFDVAYVYEAPNNHDFYGGSLSNNITISRIRTLFTNAVLNAPSDIDWTKYDWDGDGYVDQVFFLYAGYGAASVTEESIRYDYIWPHEYNIPAVNVDGVKVSTYACANELMWNANPNNVKDSGIGTFCHEFSHCLGYPDLYDADYACETTAMDFWDVLDQGSYAGSGFAPVPFTLFERMCAGWYEPTALEPNKEYTMRPVTKADGGDMYIMCNPENENEMYFFEGIKNEGWCSGLYNSKGMLAVYVDYDYEAWGYNLVNCKKYPDITDHPRYTYIPADGSYVIQYTSDVRGDLYGVNGNNTFEAKWNDGTDCAIKLKDIKILADGTLTFKTEGEEANGIQSTEINRLNRGSRLYNLAGQAVSSKYKGIIVKNGKAVLR